MTSPKHLLIESSYNVELLTENTENGKQLYIEGIFAQAEVKNGNKRIYKKEILENALNAYCERFVKTSRALGELNHPDRPFVDPAEAAILITEMRMDGNDVYGKAKVLNTPKGLIVKGLMEGGFAMGVSTRGTGSLTEARGLSYVNKDYSMSAVDCVNGPSGPNCFVNAVLESSWVLKNGVLVETFHEEKESISEEERIDNLMKFIKQLNINR